LRGGPKRDKEKKEEKREDKEREAKGDGEKSKKMTTNIYRM